ncbi:hypothetical protein GQ53DRAFT_746884 [Thozetella sp. PMI_491]|nr:hypothetical protein GQ53DRAFT_746884 [Thozetella sp. PMI_491]
MKGAVGLAALGCVLSGANAKVFRWSPNMETQKWLPPQQTMAAMLDLRGMSPKPTPAPRNLNAPPPALEKRDSTDNTCAYVGGKFTSSLYCDVTDACVYNSRRSFIGCCPESSTTCPIYTTCYNSVDSSSFSTDNGYTLYCGNSQYPNCITHKYATDDPYFSGYTLLGCAVAAGSDTVYYEPKDVQSTSSKSLKAGNTATTATGGAGGAVTVTVDPGSSTSTSASSGGGGGSSTPVGAIAGGVVGGVAGLGLIGAAIFFLIRHNSKKKNQQSPAVAPAVAPGQGPPPIAPGAPGYPPQQPPMGQYPPQGAWDPNQQTPPGGFAPVHDPRASIAKPPYDPTHSVYQPSYTNSPPGSPPPQSPHTPVYNQGTPPPLAHYPSGYSVSTMTPNSPPSVGPGYPGQGGFPNQPTPPGGYQGQHPQGYQFAAELPTQRGDGEVRELA